MQKRSTDTFTLVLAAVVLFTAIPALADESLDPAKRRMEQMQRQRRGQQDQTPQTPSQPLVQSNGNAGPGKKACDFLSKAEAESILGQPVELKDNNPYQCKYVEVGWTNKPPKNKIVSLGEVA